MSESASPKQALDQLARYVQANNLPGRIEAHDDEKLQYREVVVVVDNEAQLQAWIEPTTPYQIDLLRGIHEHGAAPGIADRIRYVVIRANGAEGVIGGAPEGAFSPAASGWSLWVRFYPEGRKILVRPSGERDLIPGRENNILLPLRKGLRPETGSTLPHQQLTQHSPPEVRQAMKAWMDSAYPLVRTGPSLVSDHVTWAMHLEGVPLAGTARILAPCRAQASSPICTLTAAGTSRCLPRTAGNS